MRELALLLGAFVSLSLSAAPTITSVSPANALTFRSEVVTIRGSGFEFCPVCSPPTPPEVFFGGMPAESVELVDSTTIRARTPRMLPGETTVSVVQWNGSALAPVRFTFTGPPTLERVLFPAFSAPVHGQFGSEFVTTARAANRMAREVRVFGVDRGCTRPVPSLTNQLLEEPDVLLPRVGQTIELTTTCSTWPGGRFLYVDGRQLEAATFNLRVHDTSRNAQSHGTELPVVRESDFAGHAIVLTGVPADPRFRVLLRVYALGQNAETVTVIVNDGVERALRLQPGRDLFEPAFASFGDFPTTLPNGAKTFTVTVIPPPEAPHRHPHIQCAPWRNSRIVNTFRCSSSAPASPA